MVYNIVLKYTMMYRGRNPNRRRTESDRTADGIRTDGERCPVSRDLVSFQTLYNIRLVPHCCLRHYVLQLLDNLHVVVLSDGDMSFRVLSVMVAACQMDDAECAVGVVMGYHASLLESCHCAVEVCRSGRYHLQHAPGIFLSREECVSFLLTKQEGMNCS